MAKEPLTPFDVPADVRAMAERSLVEARKAFSQLLDAAKTSLNTAEEKGKAVQDSARDVSTTVMALAEKNVASAFDHAQKLMQVKDPQTLIQVQMDFIRAQMQGLSEQAKELGETVSKAAADTAKKNNP
jgi:phasin